MSGHGESSKPASDWLLNHSFAELTARSRAAVAFAYNPRGCAYRVATFLSSFLPSPIMSFEQLAQLYTSPYSEMASLFGQYPELFHYYDLLQLSPARLSKASVLIVEILVSPLFIRLYFLSDRLLTPKRVY